MQSFIKTAYIGTTVSISRFAITLQVTAKIMSIVTFIPIFSLNIMKEYTKNSNKHFPQFPGANSHIPYILYFK